MRRLNDLLSLCRLTIGKSGPVLPPHIIALFCIEKMKMFVKMLDCQINKLHDNKTRNLPIFKVSKIQTPNGYTLDQVLFGT